MDPGGRDRDQTYTPFRAPDFKSGAMSITLYPSVARLGIEPRFPGSEPDLLPIRGSCSAEDSVLETPPVKIHSLSKGRLRLTALSSWCGIQDSNLQNLRSKRSTDSNFVNPALFFFSPSQPLHSFPDIIHNDICYIGMPQVFRV